jgi:hypothetical protein
MSFDCVLFVDDLLKIVFSFLDSIQDCLTILLVCKRFNVLIECRWKSLALEFWNKFIKNGNTRPSDVYNLDFVQNETGMEWLW